MTYTDKWTGEALVSLAEALERSGDTAMRPDVISPTTQDGTGTPMVLSIVTVGKSGDKWLLLYRHSRNKDGRWQEERRWYTTVAEAAEMADFFQGVSASWMTPGEYAAHLVTSRDGK